MSASIKTILVRAPNWIGDQIIAYPFFYHLRAAFPGARITSVCVPWVEAVQFRNLVDEVCVLPGHGRSFLAELRRLAAGARALRSRRPWDLGISLPNSFAAAWLLFRAGAKTRRGYRHEGRTFLLNDGVRLPPAAALHRAQIFLNLLPGDRAGVPSALEFWSRPAANGTPREHSDPAPVFDPAAAWPHAQPLEPPPGPFWVMAPGAMAESRRWPVENFAATAKLIYAQTGWKGLMVGGPAEKPLAVKLLQLAGEAVADWTARGTAASCWKIFRAAQFTLSNDSGLAHVAALCGLPGRSLVQIVWGAGAPEETRPLGPGRIQIKFNAVDCWPCKRNSCFQPAAQKLKCLRGLEPATVWQEIANAIGTQPPERKVGI